MNLNRRVGSFTCAEVLARLSAYLDGELAESELTQLAEHVQGCSTCETFGARFGRIIKELRGQPLPALDEAAKARVLKLCTESNREG
jgi:anti-sigma factor RsiW